MSVTLCLAITFASCGGKEEKKEKTNNDKTEKATEKTAKADEPEPANDKPEKNTEEPQQEKAVVIAKSGLSLRAEASGKSKLVKLLPTNSIVNILEKGEMATINGKRSPWYRVQYGKYEGYAFGGFLKMGGKLIATTDASVETAGDGRGESTSFGDVLQKGLITAPSGLTLRKSPSQKGASITVIPQNQEVGVLEFLEESMDIDGMQGVWCKVRYGRKEGYLFSAFINFSTATITAKSGLTLRERGSKDSPKITVIPSGKTVYLMPPVINDAGEMLDDSFYTDEDGVTWYKVRYGKYEGWASGEYLAMEAGC